MGKDREKRKWYKQTAKKCTFAFQFSKKAKKMNLLSILVSIICMGFMAFVLVKGIVRAVRNDRGWRRMMEDREAEGKPFYGEMEEELEKEKYGIEDW